LCQLRSIGSPLRREDGIWRVDDELLQVGTRWAVARIRLRAGGAPTWQADIPAKLTSGQVSV
jgi:hypothetical protein